MSTRARPYHGTGSRVYHHRPVVGVLIAAARVVMTVQNEASRQERYRGNEGD
jgi:hypothetical protein